MSMSEEGLSLSQSLLTSSPTIKEAAPGRCMYLVDHQPCNEEATFSRRTHAGGVFLYCNTHADQVERYFKRIGKVVLMARVKG